MTDYTKLSTWANKQYIYAVVETPRGSRCKLEFDTKLQVFTLGQVKPTWKRPQFARPRPAPTSTTSTLWERHARRFIESKPSWWTRLVFRALTRCWATRKGARMISFEECCQRLSECRALGTDSEISMRRATAIMAVCRAWVALGREVASYDAILKEEDR